MRMLTLFLLVGLTACSNDPESNPTPDPEDTREDVREPDVQQEDEEEDEDTRDEETDIEPEPQIPFPDHVNRCAPLRDRPRQEGATLPPPAEWDATVAWQQQREPWSLLG